MIFVVTIDSILEATAQLLNYFEHITVRLYFFFLTANAIFLKKVKKFDMKILYKL